MTCLTNKNYWIKKTMTDGDILLLNSINTTKSTEGPFCYPPKLCEIQLQQSIASKSP